MSYTAVLIYESSIDHKRVYISCVNDRIHNDNILFNLCIMRDESLQSTIATVSNCRLNIK